MVKGESASIMDCFESLEDPGIDRAKRRNLLDIVTIRNLRRVSAGPVIGCILNSSARARRNGSGPSPYRGRGQALELPRGIPLPRHPRFRGGRLFGGVFSRLDPARFQSCFMEWTQAAAQLAPGEAAAIDGKAMRRSHGRAGGKKAIHPVSQYGAGYGQRLGISERADPRIGYGASSGPG